ncbi:MAG: EAL domain-containing protein [Candidatus Thiodiazotropha sp. (ex Epidulcina cf. delphinae)]|nr:EAL domain-containing protein [Candidatus Thiodiazotropha sp. (ex Epidulcina cf. delphinae)]
MSIKTYLAILILTCLAGGYALEAALSRQFDNIHELSDRYNTDLLWEKDLQRTGENTAQFLISVDLILGSGNTYLLDGTFKKGVLLHDSFTELSKNTSLLVNSNILAESAKQIRSINELLAKADNLTNDNYLEKKLSELLIQHDQLGRLLEKNIRAAMYDIREKLHQDALALNDKKDHAAMIRHISRGLFSLLIAILWYWASKQISIPLRNLKALSANALTGNSFEAIASGPKEIIDLSNHLEDLTATLFYQASHDQLTGLYNRRAFERFLKKKPDEGESHIQTNALCFIDLDYFKTINDACGHAEGDKLLASVAHVLTSKVRASDIIARIGGDEFAILFIGCELEEALRISEGIRTGINDIQHSCGNKYFQVGASIGVTEIVGSKRIITEILNSADIACSIAKESGRNKVHAFDHGSELSVLHRKQMISVEQIKDAVTHNNFKLFKQDIVPFDLQANANVRMEILLRMQQPNGGIIAPDNFLPVAERYQLSNRIDRWVINQTIDWFHRHPIELENTESISINLSVQSLSDNDLKKFIIEKLKHDDFPADRLYFEIKEAEAMSNIDDAKRFMQELGYHGCKFALDNFGSGHSSYAYLKQLPTDIIKIDGALVKEMTNNSVDYATVKSIVEISKAVNQLTIAGSVENDEIAESLRKLNVDFAQGFLFSKPEPLDNYKVPKN